MTIDEINLAELTRARDQLFAEAVEQYRQGMTWWPDAEFERRYIAPEQEARYEADAWEEAIRDWLDELHDDPVAVLSQHQATARCTVPMVAQAAPHMKRQRVSTYEQRKIAAALECLGWLQTKRTATGRYYTPGPAADARKIARQEAMDRNDA